MSDYQFNYRYYKRHFRVPLITHHGIWEVREGIIIRLIDQKGNISWGEIAPIPWFGSEEISQALRFCKDLEATISDREINNIPDNLPACQFGFESALLNFHNLHINEDKNGDKFNYCYLLPAGEKALDTWEKLASIEAINTFKWKIGVNSVEEEIRIFKQLTERLSPDMKLRLDANGGLSITQARQWLEETDKCRQIEFIEQPLSPTQLDIMLKLAQEYKTPLALDESVATLCQLKKCYEQGWRGIFIIKLLIAGSPRQLKTFIDENSLKVVFSSVFETLIGKQAALNLVRDLSDSDYALGFGINHWFKEDEKEWLNCLLTSF